jgi:hypothetical protein
MQSVPLVITTHLAREGSVAAALAEIRRLPCVTGQVVRIRMLESGEEAVA